ncbi:HTH-type transcriptional regulator GltR [Sporomusa silvacetica DSM 10669]|uniref:HTH-type transcriptional regulator GltR n=1 Tax=Sporomusa silvacetica DSM 10669 TaxID=1123289 RepID=A0ABZ3IHN1_9FIRM|nr:LysR family transcriptional regulator [Sporomusa silvacetica]OZC17405.1 HTH-type transcriptional regulator GltR [Sporomusa silvacetica DSM 10669]
MDIQLFRTFLSVAKLSNITKAAEQLNFTQPAITAQIRMLEEHYGITLFERIGKKLYITEAGRELTTHAEKLLTDFYDINTAMQNFSNFNAPIKLGASTTAASYFLPPTLLEFQNRGITGSVNVDICPNLPITIKGLLDNVFDIAIVHDKISSNQIIQFSLSHEKLVWVVNHDLFDMNNNYQGISHYPFINFRPGCVFRTMFEEKIKEKDVHSIIEYSDAEAIKQAVLDGVGASILPYVLVEPFLTAGTLIELTNAPQLTFVMSVALHKNKVLTPAMKVLLLIFAEHGNMQSGLIDYIGAKS